MIFPPYPTFPTLPVPKAMKRGKQPTIVDLQPSIFYFCYPAVPVVISWFFQVILVTSYAPNGFKFNYVAHVPKFKDFRSKALKREI